MKPKKTISEHLDDRRAERRAGRAGALILAAILIGAALVIAVAAVKTAGIVEAAQAARYCEGAVCAGPAW